MNGMHDVGGMHGFGPVEHQEQEPVFHEPWQGRLLGVQIQAVRGQLYNMDEFRHGIERIHPAAYLAAEYFERWLATIETNLLEKEVLSLAELDARTEELRANARPAPPPGVSPARAVRPVAPPAGGHSGTTEARFEVGDRVAARNVHPTGHTRLPRYVRGKRGVVARV